MKQLMIIDIQQTFLMSKDIIDDAILFSKNFEDIVYIYDTLHGSPSGFYDMWEEMEESYKKGELNINNFISKEYNFLSDFMIEENGYSEEFIIETGKFLVKHGLSDAREIYYEENYLQDDYYKICEKFKVKEPDFEELVFSIPEVKDELIEKVQNGVILIGGGRNECLKEISLLLSILEINHSINKVITY